MFTCQQTRHCSQDRADLRSGIMSQGDCDRTGRTFCLMKAINEPLDGVSTPKRKHWLTCKLTIRRTSRRSVTLTLIKEVTSYDNRRALLYHTAHVCQNQSNNLDSKHQVISRKRGSTSKRTDWLANWPTNRTTDWQLTFWVAGWLTDWMNERLNDWITNWLIHWLSDWLTELMNDWMNEGRKEGRNEGTDWLADWLTDLQTIRPTSLFVYLFTYY